MEIKDVAARYSVADRTVYRWLTRGIVPGATHTDIWRVPEEGIQYLDKLFLPRVAVSGELSPNEAAVALNVDVTSIRNWCVSGRIRGAYRRGRYWVVPAEGLNHIGKVYRYTSTLS